MDAYAEKHMDFHSLEATLAEEIGVRPALIYDFLCAVCLDKSRHMIDIHDGVAWVRLPMCDLKRIFPYMCGESISDSIKKLVDRGMVNVGHYDRYPSGANWYSVE